MKNNRNIRVGVLIISLSIVAFEIILIRIFSVVLQSNLAFFAITITLLGVAIGGLLVFIFQKHFHEEKYLKRIFQYASLYTLSLTCFPIIFFNLPFNRLQISSSLNPVTFIGVILLSIIPFILGNIVLVLLFKKNSGQIKKLYFFDLTGAGVGVIIAIILMGWVGAVNGIFIISILGAIATYFLATEKKHLRLYISLFILCIIACSITNIQTKSISIHPIKRELDVGEKIFEKWNSFSRVTLHETKKNTPNKEQASPIHSYTILIDADASTEAIRLDDNTEALAQLKKDIISAPFNMHKPGTSLVIGPGGGRDIVAALQYGFKVRGIEINPIIVDDIMRNKLKDFSGNLYQRNDVKISIEDGRSFLERNDSVYTIIQIPLVDTWASATTGNLTFTESYLYTVEAFTSYLDHVEPNGIISFTRWEYDGMRLVSLFFEAYQKKYSDSPSGHIAIIAKDAGTPGQLNNYLFKKNAFTQEEMSQLEKFASENNFSVIFTPFENKQSIYSEYISSDNRENFIKGYPKNLQPTFDNNPFFFSVIPLNAMFTINKLDGGLMLILTITLLAACIITLLPLIARSKAPKQHSKISSFMLVLYFGFLGLGFLFIEIGLIQKFILYLEQPIYSYSVTLVSLLIFAGLGSYMSEKISSQKKMYFMILSLAISLLIIFFLIIERHVVASTINLPILIKIIIAFMLNMPLAACMGMMFPMGIKRLQLLGRDDLIPWVWAANGAMSVLASVLTVICAMTLGLQAVIVIAAILYIFSAFSILLSPKIEVS